MVSFLEIDARMLNGVWRGLNKLSQYLWHIIVKKRNLGSAPIKADL